MPLSLHFRLFIATSEREKVVFYKRHDFIFRLPLSRYHGITMDSPHSHGGTISIVSITETIVESVGFICGIYFNSNLNTVDIPQSRWYY